MEEEKEYGKKSYLGFVLWIIGFMAASGGGARLYYVWFPEDSGTGAMLFTLTVAYFAVVFLMWLIFITQKIYWLNGVEYEDAKEAGESRRKACARAHLILFLKNFLAWLVYCAAAVLFSLPVALNCVVFLAVVIIPAVWSMKIKL
ncbi:hypothetical protein [Anaerolentibacter hominis]|uniref:hypothetical protein n=1 Tax=Anaerolentibacter hominis TaxID=3079009 RepID=UPI0031B83056